MKQYDAIIIGFGKGGKLLAAELAERNWKVAIVERRRHIEVLEQSKRGTYRNLMLHTVLPIAYQVLLEQQIVLRLDTVLHTASIANGNLLIPLFISHCMFALERENGTQGNGHVR